MKVVEVAIRRSQSWDNPPNALRGYIKLEGEQGQIQVELSAVAMSQMFKVVKVEVVARAAASAQQVASAVLDAVHEPALLEQEQNILEAP
ncbi:MAG: hypothetical protein [Siphoviridae sp. ctdEk19]|nr:MAG: hypothetical protein [Siphoviridae sp. ctdEk19]